MALYLFYAFIVNTAPSLGYSAQQHYFAHQQQAHTSYYHHHQGGPSPYPMMHSPPMPMHGTQMPWLPQHTPYQQGHSSPPTAAGVGGGYFPHHQRQPPHYYGGGYSPFI